MEQNNPNYYEQPIPGQGGQPAPAPEKRVYTAKQRLLLLPALLMGCVVAWWWFGKGVDFPNIRSFIPAYGAFWGIYAIAFCALDPQRAKRPMSLFLLAATALLFLRFWIYEQAGTTLLNVFVIPMLLMLHAVLSTYDAPACREGQYLDLYLHGWFVAPFVSIGRFFGALGSLASGGKQADATRSRAVRVGILCALPVVIVAAVLLVRADAVMTYYFSDFFRALSIADFLWRLVAVFLVAMLFYSFLYSMVWKKANMRQEPYKKAIDPVSVLAALGLLLGLYAVFALFQFTYLTGLAGLPAGLTYSEYAVQGFHELCTVAAINFGAFALCRTFTREHKALRPMLLALLGATAMLLASALYRLALYIRAYGLTINRILPMWFMLFLLFALILCAMKLYKPGMRLVRILATVFVAWYLCLSALNLDAIIAKSILADAERTGILTDADANYLRILSADAQKVLEESPLRDEIYRGAPSAYKPGPTQNLGVVNRCEDAQICAIGIFFNGSTHVGSNADGSPIAKGETLYFECPPVGGVEVQLTVYGADDMPLITDTFTLDLSDGRASTVAIEDGGLMLLASA